MANNRQPPVDETQRKFFQELAGPNFQVTASVYQGLHEAAGGDADKMTDELMTLLSDPMAEEKRRAEELRNRDRESQLRASESDKKKREEAERKLREEVERRVRAEEAELIRKQEEAFREISRQNEEKRKKELEIRQNELARLEEEKRKKEAELLRLAELERAKAAEDQRKLEEEIQRRLVEARKKREEEEAQRLKELEAKRLREEQARKFAEEALRYAEQEREAKLRQKEAELLAQKSAENQRAQAEAQKRAEEEERIRRRVEEEVRKEKEKASAAAAAKLAEEQRLAEEVARRLRIEEQQKLEAQKAAAAAAAATPSPQKPAATAPTDAAKEQSINEMRAVYDQKLRELEERLMQYDRKIQEIKKPDSTTSAPASPATSSANKDSGSALAPVAPTVCILVDNDTPQAKTDEVTAFLTSKNVKPTDIRVVNATTDFELVQVVKGQRETLQYPSIIIRQQAVGTLEELKQYAQKIGVLEALLAGEKVDLASISGKKNGPTPPELKLGIYDYSISATEFTLKTVGTLVFLPIIAPYKLLSWAFSGKQPELQKGEDIDVIQSNWYWRHQLRTIRFLDDHMLRLRPGYNDVRALHKYDDVKEIRLADATNIVISYKSGGSDYLRTTPQDVKRICDIISAKNKMVALVKS